MPSLPDYFSDFPRLAQIAYELQCPEDVLRGHLANQHVYPDPDGRIPPEIVFEALQREIDAGRPYRPQRLVPVSRRG